MKALLLATLLASFGNAGAQTTEQPKPQTFETYILQMNGNKVVFLDKPRTDANGTTLFYHVIDASEPTVMRMAQTTVNCSKRQLKIGSTTVVSLEPAKVLDYQFSEQEWLEAPPNTLDEGVVNYACANDVSKGLPSPANSGKIAVMYYHLLQQNTFKKSGALGGT